MNFLSVFLVAAKRLWSNKGLTLCSIAGLVVAVALIGSIPMYADAANFKVLQERLSFGDRAEELDRPPFAFRYRYVGSWYGELKASTVDPVDQYLTESVPSIIGLPVKEAVRYWKSDTLGLYPVSARSTEYSDSRQSLAYVNVGFISNLMDYIELIEGSMPSSELSPNGTVDILVSEEIAEETGVQVGEEYVAVSRTGGPAGKRATVDVRVVGIWTPKITRESFWFYSPQALSKTLLVTESAFRKYVGAPIENEVETAIWYVEYDGESVRTDDVAGLLSRVTRISSAISTLLPNIEMDLSPVEALEEYRQTTFVMTIALYVFSVPILLLVFYFIGMISGLIVERQRGEISVLKSRGTGDWQVVSIYLLQGVIVGAISLFLGLLIAYRLAFIMGNANAFLSFGTRAKLPIVLTQRTILLALLGVVIAVSASLGPAMRAARLTIVTYRQNRSRRSDQPVWQRFFLDFLLLIPCGYGYYTLSNRGTINFLPGQVSGDPFSDPLLFLVPAISLFALSLLIVRLFPLVMRLLAGLVGAVTNSLPWVLAFRQLARMSAQYTSALLLVILTLGLATFTASMARTLDQSLLDRMYYKNGADLQLVEVGELPGGEGDDGLGMTTVLHTGASSSAEWVFVPVSEHLKVSGIQNATRVGAYTARFRLGESRGGGAFYGVDRLDFAKVAFYRRDFSPSQLGTMMNRLASDTRALLVSANFLEDNNLEIGDSTNLTLSLLGDKHEIEFVIADVFDYFPTYYPDEDSRYAFVSNLDYVFEQAGGLYPYQVWAALTEDADTDTIQRELSKLDVRVVALGYSEGDVEAERARPDRTGVFGILSVGFVAAAMLTVLGFLLHSYISYRRRFIEFGVLRAIGLSVSQMIGLLGLEQLLLIVTGVAAGTSLGIWISKLFVPFLQIGADKFSSTPPFIVLIAWADITKIYLTFGVMLVLAVAGMIWLLMHLKIFEAVKLGEAV